MNLATFVFGALAERLTCTRRSGTCWRSVKNEDRHQISVLWAGNFWDREQFQGRLEDHVR